MATTIVSRTQSGSESAAGRKTWTFSCWFKRCGISSSQELFGADSDGARSNNYNIIDLNSSDQIDFAGYQSGITFRKITNRRFRDTNAWYHLVIAFDTTQSTADDRIKIYINGVRETSFSTSTNPSQDHQGKFFAQNKIHAFGRSSQTFDGLISHVHATEGTAYAPTVFGSTDATTGEWKINTSPNVSYGTNGFFLFKDDNSVNNQAGNSSGNFAVSAGTLTKSEDCPSNVFATVNPLARYSANLNITNGNTTVDETGNGWQMASSTLGASTGKWYLEYKITTAGNANGYHKIGFISDEAFSSSASHIAESALDGGYAFYCSDGSLEVRTNDAVISGYSKSDLGVNLTTGSVMCLAIDMDNKRAYFRKNADAWIKSADPVNGTNGLDISADYTTGKAMIPAIAIYQGGAGSINFGSGYFGQSAVSSAGTNASGNGIFEYDVPTGYTALSTKGLNL